MLRVEARGFRPAEATRGAPAADRDCSDELATIADSHTKAAFVVVAVAAGGHICDLLVPAREEDRRL